MKNKSVLITLIFFLTGVMLMFAGVLAKLQHWPFSNMLFSAGFLIQIIAFVLAIIVVLRLGITSKQKNI